MRPSMKVTMSRRAGFTLIELLIAITIIILLIGLLVPALSAVRRNARIAEVKTNISSLESALTEFKTTFGDYPPSQITLQPSGGTWDSRSRAIIRKIWPQFNFSTGGGAAWTTPQTLTGAECLVFFLGGIPEIDPKTSDPNDDEWTYAFQGFSNNPSTPFSATGTSRVGPFYEFTASRLIHPNDPPLVSADGWFQLLDPITDQTSPYIYLSGYDGRGYETADLGGSGMTDFYTEVGTKAWKAKSFQIISPGFDYSYGTGGPFDPKTADSTLIGPRAAERDNITNFHGGTLAN